MSCRELKGILGILEKTLLLWFCHWKVDQMEVIPVFLRMVLPLCGLWIDLLRGSWCLGQTQIHLECKLFPGVALGCTVVKLPVWGIKEPESPGCPFHCDSQSAGSTTRDFIASSRLSYWHIFDTICTSHFARRAVTITISRLLLPAFSRLLGNSW